MTFFATDIFEWTDRNTEIDNHSTACTWSWSATAGLCGGIASLVLALLTVKSGLFWQLVILAIAIPAAPGLFLSFIWIVWLIMTLVAVLKKVLAADFFNDCAKKVADLISTTNSQSLK